MRNIMQPFSLRARVALSFGCAVSSATASAAAQIPQPSLGKAERDTKADPKDNDGKARSLLASTPVVGGSPLDVDASGIAAAAAQQRRYNPQYIVGLMAAGGAMLAALGAVVASA